MPENVFLFSAPWYLYNFSKLVRGPPHSFQQYYILSQIGYLEAAGTRVQVDFIVQIFFCANIFCASLRIVLHKTAIHSLYTFYKHPPSFLRLSMLSKTPFSGSNELKCGLAFLPRLSVLIRYLNYYVLLLKHSNVCMGQNTSLSINTTIKIIIRHPTLLLKSMT